MEGRDRSLAGNSKRSGEEMPMDVQQFIPDFEFCISEYINEEFKGEA